MACVVEKPHAQGRDAKKVTPVCISPFGYNILLRLTLQRTGGARCKQIHGEPPSSLICTRVSLVPMDIVGLIVCYRATLKPRLSAIMRKLQKFVSFDPPHNPLERIHLGSAHPRVCHRVQCGQLGQEKELSCDAFYEDFVKQDTSRLISSIHAKSDESNHSKKCHKRYSGCASIADRNKTAR